MKRGMRVKTLHMLACDMGASNGRIVYGILEDGTLIIRELHRFVNRPVRLGGVLYWDFLQLFQEIKNGLAAAAKEGLPIDTMGLNSWGNTIGLLDCQGDLLAQPYHYRDSNSHCILASMQKEIPKDKQFTMTLFKPMDIQPTVFLKYLEMKKTELLSQTDTILMISDLFNYFLTGVKASEITMAATSQLLDIRSGRWNHHYREMLGIPDRFPDIILSGTPLGNLTEEIISETGISGNLQVIAVAGHDTAAASVCADMEHKAESLYLSCGTWSCMGCLIDDPIEDLSLIRYGLTNDLSLYGKRNLRFNHTGLWILQECKREWELQGQSYSWSELTDMANESEPFHSFIDTEAQDFFKEGRMVEKIKEYCRRTGQSIPESVGEIVRNVCESLALRYRYSRDCLELYADCRFRKLQLLGGGSRNELLCQSTADALGIMVAAGPVEASVTGNFIQQAIAAGMIQSMEEGLRIIERTWKCKTYHPNAVRENEWERIYKRMSPVFGWLPIVKGEGNERSSAKIQERT